MLDIVLDTDQRLETNVAHGGRTNSQPNDTPGTNTYATTTSGETRQKCAGELGLGLSLEYGLS